LRITRQIDDTLLKDTTPMVSPDTTTYTQLTNCAVECCHIAEL